MRKLATILIVAAATAGAADAKPKKGSAKVHMDKAAKAHKDGKFDVALTELKAAYEIDPQPKLLYAIGQVYAKLDDCEQAIDHYEKFSDATKDKSKRAVAKQAIDACKKRLAELKQEPEQADRSDKPDKSDAVFRAKKPPADELPTADTKPDEPSVETAPPPPVETAPVEEPKPEPAREIKAFDEPPPAKQPEPAASVTATSGKKPWYKDPIGDALVITGIGAGVGSLVMYLGARSDLDAAESAGSLAQYNEHHDSAEKKQLYTVVFGAAGAALVVAGVVRYQLRSSGTESRSIAIVPTGDGGLITWSGGF